MAIATDFSVATNGDIRYTGSTANYTVLALHRFLQDLADNATSSGDDLADITSVNPSTRSTDGIITLNSTYNIDATAAQHLYGGSISQAGGDTLYSGLQVIGSVSGTTQLQVVQNNAIFSSFWSTGINASGSIINRILIKSRDSGADIDFKQIRVFAREYGDTYAEFNVTLGLGEAVAAISTSADTFNTTSSATIGALTFTNTAGYQTIDLSNGNGAQPYYSQFDRGTNTAKQLYEYSKYVQRRGTSTSIYGMNGALFRGITHSIAYSAKTGSPTQSEVVSWGSGATAGTGALLAFPGTSSGSVYIQLLTGVIVTTGTVTGGTSSATWTATGTTARTVPSTFLGLYTGSITGAYGIGIKASTLTASDTITDLTNTVQTPPNNQSFTVTGLVSGDRILVAKNDGSGGIKYNQFAAAAGNSSGNSTLVISGSIPSDTPASATLRALISAGTYDRIPYTSWTGSTFTLTSTLANTIATSANVWVSYIDKATSTTSESFTSTYSGSDLSLIVEVRNGSAPIVPFISPATFSSTGGSVAAIRTPDA